MFIDLKKAFDIVNHKLLYQKMECIGISGVAFKWINSYLEKRKQFVSFDKCNSDMRNICHVVSHRLQYWSRNYLFYILMIKCNISNLVKFILFADNTNIYQANSNISKLNETICYVLENLWFAVNKLTVNITQTNYMLFGSQQRSQYKNAKC